MRRESVCHRTRGAGKSLQTGTPPLKAGCWREGDHAFVCEMGSGKGCLPKVVDLSSTPMVILPGGCRRRGLAAVFSYDPLLVRYVKAFTSYTHLQESSMLPLPCALESAVLVILSSRAAVEDWLRVMHHSLESWPHLRSISCSFCHSVTTQN